MMNDPLTILFKEHDIIVSVVNKALSLKEYIHRDPEKYIILIRKMVNIFKNYADQFHHQKEEMLLFPKMCEENEMLREGIIKEMMYNHEDFRNMIKEIEKAVNNEDLTCADTILRKYCNDLLDHIAIENDELFQMCETLFSQNDMEKLYFNFLDKDRELGETRKEELQTLAEKIIKEI